MRILALRGQNLASLAAFDIDLKAPPLDGAGLFAITGDTGAGKSTLLDAMCLALYGDYPRAEGAKSEKISDASGVELTTKDARNILRRGAADGFAEVDFVGQDGVGYRARWAVRRARGKVLGRLQSEDRTLERLDGSGAVASGKEPVLAAVEDKTGLTFDQFRRTVLLAQGDFDAFLLADEGARSDLLEKLTGTEIYTRISMRVHDETATHKRRIDDLKLRQGEVVVLDAEARGDAIKARDAARSDVETRKATVATASKRVAHFRGIADAQSALESARTTLASAEAALAQEAETVAAAQLARQVAPLVEPFRALQTETEIVTRLTAEKTALANKVATAATALTGAVAARDRAEAEHKAAAATYKSFEPQWRDVAALDAQIESASNEVRGAEAAYKAAAAALAKADDDIAALDVASLLPAGTAATGSAAAQALEAALSDNRLAREAALVERRRLDAQLVALDVATLRRRSTELLALSGAADKALALAREAVGRDGAVAVAETEIAGTTKVVDVRKGELAKAEQAAQTATAAAEAMSALGDQADATLSAQAKRLRAELSSGVACPVCGATDHVYGHDDPAMIATIEAMRVARDDTRKHAKTAADAVAAAQVAVQVADVAQKRATDDRTAAMGGAANARANLDAATAVLTPRLMAHDIAVDLSQPAPGAKVALLEGLIVRVGDEEQALSAKLSEAEAINKKVHDQRLLLDEIDDKVTRLQALEGALGDRSSSQKDATEAQRVLAGRTTARDELIGKRAALLGGEALSDHQARIAAATDTARLAHDKTQTAMTVADGAARELRAAETRLSDQLNDVSARVRQQQDQVNAGFATIGVAERVATAMLARPATERDALVAQAKALEDAVAVARQMLKTRTDDLKARLGDAAPPDAADIAAASDRLQSAEKARDDALLAVDRLDEALRRDDEARGKISTVAGEIKTAESQHAIWAAVDEAVGSAKGDKFRRFAQGVTLEHLVALANAQLDLLNPRYRLRRAQISDLNLEVADRDMGDEVRSPRSLSGGERFLVSLALALALAGLEGRQSFVDTLFIDEGFGSLDRDTLDVAIDALETLQGQGRQVGVITHVGAMIERIAVQIRVEKRGGGRSIVRLVGGGT